MVEKDSLSSSKKRKLQRIKINRGEDTVPDGKDRVALINSDTASELKSHYNFEIDAHTRELIEKMGGEVSSTPWSVAYDDSVSFFETMSPSGFTDEILAWLTKSYDDPVSTVRSNMSIAACVGMGIVFTAFEAQMGEGFIEKFERATVERRKSVNDFLSKNTLNPKSVLTPASQGRRGQLPQHQIELGRIVGKVSENASYPSCVMDGAVMMYKLIDSAWYDLVSEAPSPVSPTSQQIVRSGETQTGRHLIVTTEEQARVRTQGNQL